VGVSKDKPANFLFILIIIVAFVFAKSLRFQMTACARRKFRQRRSKPSILPSFPVCDISLEIELLMY